MCDTRRLTPRELDAIRVGLRMLLDADAADPLFVGARDFEGAGNLLGDRDVVALLEELSRPSADVWISRVTLPELLAARVTEHA
jgi:hypothetical protein